MPLRILFSRRRSLSMVASIPRVSIGMPVYNAERYLREALDSLLAQTFADFELIISDNASEDATASICREYAARDSRVKYHRHDSNRGSIQNFNHTVKLATGEYFKWAAYDDLHDPAFLSRCVKLLDAHPDVVWCHTLTVHIDADGNVIPADNDTSLHGDAASHSLLARGERLPSQTRACHTPEERFAGVLLGTTWCADSFGLIRTSVLRSTSLMLPCYGSEKVLMGELGLRGRYAEVPEVLFYERLHGEASAALRTAADQQSFVTGDTGQRFTSTRWDLLAGHIRAVGNAPVSFMTRLRCASVLLRYVFQLHKWKTILSQMLTRSGVGAETRSAWETGDRARPNDRCETQDQSLCELRG